MEVIDPNKKPVQTIGTAAPLGAGVVNQTSAQPTLDKHLKSIQEVQQVYQQGASNKNFNALIYGPTGSGKTRLLKTARRPIYAYIFDPQGEKTIRDEINEGWIIADTRFQSDDIRSPHLYKDWEKDYREKKAAGFFDIFGTTAFDSITTWASLVMNRVIKDSGRQPGAQIKYEGHMIESYGVPFQQDYMPQMAIIEHMVKDIMGLPCDVIFTAHPDIEKDEVSGKMFAGPMVTGKLKARLPLLFTEIYCATVKESSSGVTYSLLTRNTGVYMARTRLGKEGIFDMYEQPDIKHLLKKAGLPIEDKQIPWLGK